MVLKGIGRCPAFFWMAISLDVGGLSLLLVGIFANVQVGGRGFGDCLVYSGSIIVFFSLVWWLFWCTGNIELPPEELENAKSLAQLTRGFSERLPVKSKDSPREVDATAIRWDTVQRFSETAPPQTQQPRYVELSNVRYPQYILTSRVQQQGERLV
ncbi:transmembrane protein 238-like [Chiloscyllium plagiosum]|uniref:transmembrane protein 238-like n=1 Tax=Chiloscyllium plagiosum TaxID=36176 RepID=UPI001CB85CC6|nr:transmembrane protein 238-like [Chiloscyllium plagiosum]